MQVLPVQGASQTVPVQVQPFPAWVVQRVLLLAAVGELQLALAEQLPPTVVVQCFSSVAELAFAVLGQLVHLPGIVPGRNGLPCWAVFRLELPEAFFLLLRSVLQQIPVAADSSNIWFAALQPVVVLLLRTNPEWVLVQWYQSKYPAVLPDGMTVLLVLAVVQQLFPLLTFPDTAELVLAFPFLCLLAVSHPAFFPPLSSAGALLL